MNLRDQKGINLITLSVAIIILILITSILVFNSGNAAKTKNLNNLYNDIEILDSKVSAYYLEKDELPNAAEYNNTSFKEALAASGQKNPNDGDSYCVIDLKFLQGVTLNYGRDYDNIRGLEDKTERTNIVSTYNYEDIYVINKQSHTIYYPKGVLFEDKTYYTTPNEWAEVELVDVPDKGIIAKTAETAPWLPTGCTVTNRDLSTGITIKDANKNEWTWVVVPKSVTAEVAAVGAEEEPTNSALENALKSYAATTVTNRGSYTDTWYSQAQTGMTSEQYTSKKRSMLNSIKNNGGFWIGKYEVGYTGDSLRTTTNGMTANEANNPTNQTPVIKQNAYPYNFVTCSQAEGLAESLTSGLGGTGSLMFGIQWDLALVYLKLNTNPQIDPNNSISWGNHKDSSFSITNANAKGTTTPTTGGWNTIISKAQNTSTLLTTGAEESVTNKLNIVDLAGNVWEWTLEKSSDTNNPCVSRGGPCGRNGMSSDYPASYRFDGSTSNSNWGFGFRPSLY